LEQTQLYKVMKFLPKHIPDYYIFYETICGCISVSQMTMDKFPILIESFPHSWLITGFVTKVTRRVLLVEQELLTLPEHLSITPVLSMCCPIFSFLCSVLYNIVWGLPFCLLTNVLSVRLRSTAFVYPFDIFKHLLQW